MADHHLSRADVEANGPSHLSPFDDQLYSHNAVEDLASQAQ